jgi:hypothetical protein
VLTCFGPGTATAVLAEVCLSKLLRLVALKTVPLEAAPGSDFPNEDMVWLTRSRMRGHGRLDKFAGLAKFVLLKGRAELNWDENDKLKLGAL